jgi:hypothetical protein
MTGPRIFPGCPGEGMAREKRRLPFDADATLHIALNPDQVIIQQLMQQMNHHGEERYDSDDDESPAETIHPFFAVQELFFPVTVFDKTLKAPDTVCFRPFCSP